MSNIFKFLVNVFIYIYIYMSKYNCVVYYADIEVVVKKSRTEMKTVKVLTEKVPPGKVRSRLTIAQVMAQVNSVYMCVELPRGQYR